MKRVAQMEMWRFVKTAILPLILPIIADIATCYALTRYVNIGDNSFRFFVTGIVSVVVTGIVIITFATNKSERQTLMEMIKKHK